VISAVARAPPGLVSTPTEKHIDDRDPSDHDGLIDVDVVETTLEKFDLVVLFLFRVDLYPTNVPA